VADQPFSAAIVTPRIAAGMSPNACAKWLFVAAIGTLDWVWMNAAGFRFGDGFLACAAAACALAAIALVYFYTERDERIRDFAHFGAQFLALSLVLIPLESLAVSTNAPLADRSFVALDQGMGLDWVAWAQWVSAHSLIHWALGVAYASIWLQTILAFMFNVHARANQRNSELWWIIAFSSLLTIAGGAVLPASNPWIYNGLAAVDDFLHAQQFAALRAGTMHVLGLYNTEGLIQLPSFHTVLAIMLAYNFRHHRWLFTAAIVLDTLIILSCPTEGSHYFVDLIAGAAVAAVAIVAARGWERWLDSWRPGFALAVVKTSELAR
jgi:hypothetical protein